MMGSLRQGTWLTPARARGYCIILIVMYTALALGVLATAHGKLDVTGKPIGTDFSQVWIAGRSVPAGDPTQPFDPARHFAAQRAAFGWGHGVDSWHYPPYFLAVAAPLALLPYLPALLVWQAGSFLLYLAVMRRLLPGAAALLGSAAFPGVIVNLGHGQNGFLTAALMGGGLASLSRRPWMAGAAFALLAYKPQFGLVVPVALLAGRHWQALAGAAATLALMTVATVLAFGAQSWVAFARGLAFTRNVVLQQDGIGWEKMQSAFAVCRMWGGDLALASAAQLAVSVSVLAATAWVWARSADARARGAALLAAALLATPYCMDYDLMLLAPALAMLVSLAGERGFLTWEKTLLAAIWATPLFARLAARIALLPLGLIAVATLFIVAVRCARLRPPALALA